MSPRTGDETDDYCTRCHRLTNHTVTAMVGDGIATVTCRTCGFQHPYKGGKPPRTSAKAKPSAFDQVLAGILGETGAAPSPTPPARRGGPRRRS